MHLVHRWSRWEDISSPVVFFVRGMAEAVPATEPAQTRICHKCGKRQTRSVVED